MSTRTRFEKEAKGNSEMAYSYWIEIISTVLGSFSCFFREEFHVPYREPTRTKEHDSVLLSKICRWHSGQNAQRESATDFLQVLNSVHPSLSFTMELEHEESILFFSTVITRSGTTLKTEVYRKPADKGLLLHFQSYVANSYKKGLVNTMVIRAYRLSSTEETFTKECDKLRTMFSKLRYPNTLVNFTIHRLINARNW